MKKIGIVVTDPEDWTAKALFRAAREKNLSPLFIDLRAAEVSIAPDPLPEVRGTCLSELDAVLVRDVGAGTLEGVSFRFDILRELEFEGIQVVNSPAAIQNAANKYHASYLLAKAGLPVPKTRAVQSVDAGLKAISEFEDAIIKPVFGYKGKGIVRVKAGDVLFSDRKARAEAGENSVSPEKALEELLGDGGMLYIQEFIENPGRDIRAFVVNGKAVGAIYRRAPPGSWINNLSQGGSADRCVLSEEEKTIAEKAALALGADFAGVDIIEGKEEREKGEERRKKGEERKEEKSLPKLLEVNGTPSGKGIYDTWGINPAEEIIRYLEEKLK